MGVLQVGFGVAAELDDVVLLVHDHAGGCVAGEQDPVRFPGQLLAEAGFRRHRPALRRLSTARPGSAEPQAGRGGAGPLEVDPVLLVHGREESSAVLAVSDVPRSRAPEVSRA